MLGRSLKVLRIFHQLKQTELAKKLDISNSYLSEIESEIKTPGFDLLIQYSEIFKIPVSSILLFSENLENSKPSEKIRVKAADKILRMLEWVSDKNSIDEPEKKIPA
jgi:transcriptional regulator with XRE-family HTH domain